MCILLNTKEKILIDSKTGDIVKPSCFDGISQYVSYYKNKYRTDDGVQRHLKKIFKGEMKLADMIEKLGNNK